MSLKDSNPIGRLYLSYAVQTSLSSWFVVVVVVVVFQRTALTLLKFWLLNGEQTKHCLVFIDQHPKSTSGEPVCTDWN